MKRYILGAGLLLDLAFVLSLDADPWQGWIVFAAIAAAVVLAVLEMRDRSELKAERECSAELRVQLASDERQLAALRGPRRSPDVDDPTRRLS